MQSPYGHPIGSSDSGHPICLEGPCPRYKLKVVGKPSKKLGFPINGVVAQPHNCGAISQIPLSKCSFWLKKNWMYPHYRSPGSWLGSIDSSFSAKCAQSPNYQGCQGDLTSWSRKQPVCFLFSETHPECQQNSSSSLCIIARPWKHEAEYPGRNLIQRRGSKRSVRGRLLAFAGFSICTADSSFHHLGSAILSW